MRVPFTILVAAMLGSCATEKPVTVSPPPGKLVHADPPGPAWDRYKPLVGDANRHMVAGDPAAALASADQALRIVPFGIVAGVVKVEAHLALGQRIEALDYAGRLRDQNPDVVEAHYAYGKAAYALGRISDARDAFSDCLARAATDFLCRLGLLTALAHDPKVPLEELRARADELWVGTIHPDALNALGMACELRGDNTEAERFYSRAISVRDRHPWAHYNLALLLHARSGMPAARRHFQSFLAQAPPTAVREIEAVKKLLEENP